MCSVCRLRPRRSRRSLRIDPPNAVDRLVDRLLTNPHYGERWARHWLDVARFAETNGFERDAVKPNAWKYRDYVIDSLNADKPFDRFLTEQLAGDELPDANPETMIAGGFLRAGPWDDEPADPKQDRFDQLDDVVSAISETFLGLTIGCARCHDHKFEPLTMHDYYRMVAVFDPLDRPRADRMELDRPLGTPEQLVTLATRDRNIEALQSSIAEHYAKARDEYLSSGRSGLPKDVIEALAIEPSKRSPEQKELAAQHQKRLETEVDAALSPQVRTSIAELRSRIDGLRAECPDPPRGYFFVEQAGRTPETHLLLRGQATAPGASVAPGMPAVLVDRQPEFLTPGRTTRRRLTLARWMTRPEHPLTARVIVNRVWQHHFGEGLVRTPNDFGVMGDPPTHPELLDWLAATLVQDGWSLKRLHRLILTSRTYRMSKTAEIDRGDDDPEDRLMWRFPYKRLEAEAVRDAMLAVAGGLDATMHGPSVFPEVPRAAVQAHTDPEKIWPVFDERAASRRTVYAMMKRSFAIPMLEVLDLCDATRSTGRRNVTSIAPQALTLLNGEFVNRQASHFARRVMREAGEDPVRRIERAYILGLGRPPTQDELEAMQEYLKAEAVPVLPVDGPARPTDEVPLTRLCRLIFNLNEFVYTD